jgi:hypothetical protein
MSGHTHGWSYFSAGLYWRSWNWNGQVIDVFAWTNGIDGEGSGYFPLGTGFGEYLYTDSQGGHTHEFPMSAGGWSVDACLPYVQLLACQKG